MEEKENYREGEIERYIGGKKDKLKKGERNETIKVKEKGTEHERSHLDVRRSRWRKG